MPTSTLSFGSSAAFRDALLAKNLPPYDVPGVYTPPSGQIVHETQLSVSNVIDSPDELIANDPFANLLYPLNEYGPNGGFNTNITFNGPPLPVASNQGEYDPTDTVLDLVNEFYIDAAYIENRYGPNGGFNDMVIITDIQNNNKIYQPYWDPPSYVPSSYTPYSILFSDNPTGSDGTLSQDSYLAKIGATELNLAFKARIDAEIFQNTVGQVNLESLTDPFEASLIVTGQEPLVYRNYRITVPESPIVAAFDFATRLASAYWPVSLIPGDYFNENKPGFLSQQTSNALNVVNQLTGGFLGPILNKTRNPSEIFLANTGNGQRSMLFRNIEYNRYQPDYKQQFGGLLGVAQAIVNLAVNIINPNNGTLIGGYYVGSRNAEPSTISSPPNQLPVDPYGRQVETSVYGPSELAILYEGNQDNLNFGLAAKPLSDGGGIDGQFVWTSPKYKGNAGFKATPGGGTGSLDGEFNQVSSYYTRDESTNFEYKQGSILDQTQRLVESADNTSGINRLKHVGNAINQVSKVFNDGYKEMTKGSQVLSYTDFTTGAEQGIEYCRVFTKDTPYYTYADLQKTDGITKSGRRFTNSVLDNTYNLNIAPLKNPGSTNIIPNNSMGKGGYAKKYMFSIENLAWRTSSRPGFTYDELPVCEKGPNGGRVMWFPPYDIKFSDTSSANWQGQSFLGRPEPIYTYKDTSRTGTLSWKIVVDHPSIMNVIVDKQLKGVNKERMNSILDSFFAGCVKYDIYQLGLKFNTIPTRDLYYYQEKLSDPRLTPEELAGIKRTIPADNSGGAVKTENKQISDNTTKAATPNELGEQFTKKFNELAFYFHNDRPDPNTNSVVSTVNFKQSFELYETQYLPPYQGIADSMYKETNQYCKTNPSYCSENKQVTAFWKNIIKDNFTQIDDATNGLVASILKLVKDNNANVAIDLLGSASAPASENYNVNLSARRIDSVRKYLLESQNGVLKPYEKQITINGKPIGEENKKPSQFESIVVPKSVVGGDTGRDVNCNTNIIDGSVGKTTSNSQIYSVDAMACRRVKFTAKVTFPTTENKQDQTTTTETSVPPKTIDETINPKKPTPTKTVEQKLKDGIGKRILRQLLSECDYFEVIEKEVPMLYDSIKEKIRYFNPAFHSTTPEGLNARLTFLNQCVRPGETIPIIGPDGKPKYNDAVNTSFGAPPVLVLRIGDFFHTKIIPDNVAFSYEPLLFDMNPEGIGVQPMIVNVSMNFKIIGGMGLAKPVEQLQNALSFNYYANTEIYDERSVWTEDTSALDKQLIEKILLTQPLETVDNVDTQSQNDFGSTIGTIINLNRVEGGETGEIGYGSFMDKFRGDTVKYFETVTNKLESINSQNNYGVLQLLNEYRNYTTGDTYTEGFKFVPPIYGKPILSDSSGKNLFTELFNKSYVDVENETNPIIKELINGYANLKPDEKKVIKTNITNYLKGLNATFSNEVQTVITELSQLQASYIQNIRKVELVNGGVEAVEMSIDGKKLEDGTPLVYNLTGSDKVSEKTTQTGIENTYVELEKDVRKLYDALALYEEKLIKYKILTDKSYVATGDFALAGTSLDNNVENKTFFMIVSRNFSNPNKLQEFKNFVISNQISGNNKLRKKFDDIVDNLVKTYNKELESESKLFTTFKESQDYKTFIEGADELMYPLGKTRIFNFTTVPASNNTQKVEKLKKLFATVNEGPKTTYLGKIKFD